jgi:hypothetical protein
VVEFDVESGGRTTMKCVFETEGGERFGAYYVVAERVVQ